MEPRTTNPWKIAVAVLAGGWILTVVLTAWLGNELASTRAELGQALARAEQIERPVGDRRPGGLRPFAPKRTVERQRSEPTEAVDDLADDEPLPPEILERAREQMRSNWRDRHELRAEQAREALVAYVEDNDLDPALVDEALDLWDDQRERLGQVRDQALSGEVDRLELRERFRTIREEGRAAMVDLFGEDGADELLRAMPNPPMGGRPGLRGGPIGSPIGGR